MTDEEYKRTLIIEKINRITNQMTLKELEALEYYLATQTLNDEM